MKSFILSLLVLLPTFALAQSDNIVATVNGTKISLEELKAYYKQNLLSISGRKVTLESSLDELINRELGVNLAKKNEIIKDPAVSRKVDDLLFHAQISKDLESKLLKIAATISDDDVKEYYKENKEYRTSHILIRLRAIPSPDDVKKAFQQMVLMANEIKSNGDKFEELASKYSQSSSAYNSGDLGFHPPNGYVPEFYEAIKGKKVGQVVGPIRTQYGVHIIKITDIKPYEKINKDVYKKIIHDQKRDKIMDEYFSSLRKDANIKINKQFLK